jgi:hypothetical protein
LVQDLLHRVQLLRRQVLEGAQRLLLRLGWRGVHRLHLLLLLLRQERHGGRAGRKLPLRRQLLRLRVLLLLLGRELLHGRRRQLLLLLQGGRLRDVEPDQARRAHRRRLMRRLCWVLRRRQAACAQYVTHQALVLLPGASTPSGALR